MSNLAAFRFAELPTPAAIQPWFLTWWEFRVGEGAPSSHHVPPDGCTNLLLINQGTPREMLVAMGPFLAPRVVPAFPGMRTTGLRLHPAAAPAVLGTDAAPLANQLLPLAQLPGIPPAALVEVLRQPTLDDVASTGNALLMPLRERLPPTDALASAALQQIWRTAGRTPLPAIAAALGCSPRTMLRRVRAASGLTPKQYARIIRFHSAVRGLVDQDIQLSHLAAQGGYADQPHFHHEVTALTGLTPAQLAARVRSTEHRLSREQS
jgi:AraC-like DNA-binding protein